MSFKEVFEGLGEFPDEYKIKPKDSIEGWLNLHRRVLESIKVDLKIY